MFLCSFLAYIFSEEIHCAFFPAFGISHFIRSISIRNEFRMIGFVVGAIFYTGLSFLLVSSFSAAFIPSSPFESSISDFTAFFLNTIFSSGWAPLRTWRLIILWLTSAGAVASMILPVIFRSPNYQLMIFYPVAVMFAVAARTPEPSQDYAPLCGPPLFVLGLSVVTVVVGSIAVYFNKQWPIYVSICCTLLLCLGLEGLGLNRLTRYAPDTLEAEAIAWLFESSPSQESSRFENAGRVADSAQRKMLLLNTLLPLFSPLISSHLEQPHELRVYILCLAHLSDFSDSEQSIMENKAGVEHPPLPPVLRERLQNLRSSTDIHQIVGDAAEEILRHFEEA
jgi:hypothetical protein